MEEPVDDARLIHLDPADNVCALARSVTAGEELSFQGRILRAASAIAVGHKIAVFDIARGQKVLKYGAIIGSATSDIAAGEWVHTHNLASDYIPTYARGELESRSSSKEST